MNASYRGRPIRLMAFSSRFDGSPPASPACEAMSWRASWGPMALPKNWLIVPRLIGSG